MGASWREGVACVWRSGASREAEPRARLGTALPPACWGPTHSGPAPTAEKVLGRGWPAGEGYQRTHLPCPTWTWLAWFPFTQEKSQSEILFGGFSTNLFFCSLQIGSFDPNLLVCVHIKPFVSVCSCGFHWAVCIFHWPFIPAQAAFVTMLHVTAHGKGPLAGA